MRNLTICVTKFTKGDDSMAMVEADLRPII